jgi:hypothetical protein
MRYTKIRFSYRYNTSSQREAGERSLLQVTTVDYLHSQLTAVGQQVAEVTYLGHIFFEDTSGTLGHAKL